MNKKKYIMIIKKQKNKRNSAWAEERGGGSAEAWCGDKGIGPKAVGGRKQSREGRHWD